MDIDNLPVKIYAVGVVLAFIISIIELFRSRNDKNATQYSMVVPMWLLSWVTVFAWIYGFYNNKHEDNERSNQ